MIPPLSMIFSGGYHFSKPVKDIEDSLSSKTREEINKRPRVTNFSKNYV